MNRKEENTYPSRYGHNGVGIEAESEAEKPKRKGKQEQLRDTRQEQPDGHTIPVFTYLPPTIRGHVDVHVKVHIT